MPKMKNVAENEEKFRGVLKARGIDAKIGPKLDEGLKIYTEWKQTNPKLGAMRAEMNKLAEQFNKTKDKQLLEKTKEIKTKIAELELTVRKQEETIEKIEIVLPNWLDPTVPIGVEGEGKNLKYVGRPKVTADAEKEFAKNYPGVGFDRIDYKPFHHYDLVWNLVDQEKAGEVAQARFYYELGDLVLLDFALSMYAIEFFRKKGYAGTLMIPPYMLRKEIEAKTTYFEAFEDTLFEVEKEGLVLIPSSEHPILAYYKERMFDVAELPLRITAWSPAFRQEAGSHGKDTKGIFRVKQFHKAEIHSIVKKGEDLAELDRIVDDAQEFMTTLGIPTRTVLLPSADMDKRATKQIDIEAWMPGQGVYRETHSLATIDTWASEKLGMRYREGETKELTRHVYATAVAVQRAICAVAENCYDPKKKAVIVPEPLKKYMMGVEEIRV